MIFDEAFDLYILDQKVIGWGFQQPTKLKLPNGFHAFPCGYFTTYENGYRLIISGESLGKTPIQEAMILDPDGTPIARDTEDIRDMPGNEQNTKTGEDPTKEENKYQFKTMLNQIKSL